MSKGKKRHHSRAKILDRVRKLRELANDPNGNENECASAAARMAELMLQHRIEEAELGEAGNEENAFYLLVRSHEPLKWHTRLAGDLAKAHGCVGISGRGSLKGIWLFGPEERVEVTKYVFYYVAEEILKIVLATGIEKHRRDDYCAGVVDRVVMRIAQQLEEAKRKRREQQWADGKFGTDQALALIDKQDQEVFKAYKDFVESTGRPVQEHNTNEDNKDLAAYLAGYRKGDEIVLPQTGPTPTRGVQSPQEGRNLRFLGEISLG